MTENVGYSKKKNDFCPGQVAQLVGTLSPKGKVVGLIPGQGSYLGCGFDPQSKCIWEATN